jgi:hypothetical protein
MSVRAIGLPVGREIYAGGWRAQSARVGAMAIGCLIVCSEFVSPGLSGYGVTHSQL